MQSYYTEKLRCDEISENMLFSAFTVTLLTLMRSYTMSPVDRSLFRGTIVMARAWQSFASFTAVFRVEPEVMHSGVLKRILSTESSALFIKQ